MPPTPDQSRLYRAPLFKLGAPQSAIATPASLEQLAWDILRRIGPHMLFVGEVNHLLAGSHREPVAPRRFPDEAFDSWFGPAGRARYRMTVDELAQIAGVNLGGIGTCSERFAWLIM